MKKLLGIDVGTTSMKAGLYDGELNEICSESAEYSLISSGEIVEFDAEEYIALLEKCLSPILKEHTPDAISIDTQCETLIITDENGNPLRKAIVWLDNRASEEAYEIERHFGNETVYSVTGQPQIAAAWPASKLLWIKKHEPEIFNKTKKIFLLADWLCFRMTGCFATEPTLQSSSLYFDIRNGNWWNDMLSFIGIEKDKLPKLLKTSQKVGEYKGIPVIMGAMDQIAGAVGMGAVGKGIITEMTGTTLAVFAGCDGIPKYIPESIIPCHINYDGSYVRLMWTSAAGLALKWFKEGFCENYSYKELDILAEKAPAGSDGVTFVPHLCGSTMPIYDPSASAAFCGVKLSHTREHFVRAVMESVAFMLKECIDCIGSDIKEIRSSGGASKSDVWCQMKADVLKKDIVTLSKKETATLGSAIFAGVGIGVFSSVEAAARLIKTAKQYKPSETDYEKAYIRYTDYSKKVNPQ